MKSGWRNRAAVSQSRYRSNCLHSRNSMLMTLLFIQLWVIILPAQIRLAVGEFKNDSDVFFLDQWEKTVPELLQSRLSGSSELLLLERRKIEAVLEEKALSQTGLMDSTRAQEIGTLLEAEYVIFGTIHYIDQNYRINASIVNVRSGQVKVEQVVGPDQKHLEKMIDLLTDNIIYTLTGKGKFREKVTVSRYPTRYFMIATVGLGIGTLVANSAYQKNLDEYHSNTDLEKFDDLYNNANRTHQLTVGLAVVTGTALLGTVYCWIRNLSPEEIYAGGNRNQEIVPRLALYPDNEVRFSVQILF